MHVETSVLLYHKYYTVGEKGKKVTVEVGMSKIIDKKEITHADVVTLIDNILVYERKGDGLDIEVV